jgi:hypothetical protein
MRKLFEFTSQVVDILLSLVFYREPNRKPDGIMEVNPAIANMYNGHGC